MHVEMEVAHARRNTAPGEAGRAKAVLYISGPSMQHKICSHSLRVAESVTQGGSRPTFLQCDAANATTETRLDAFSTWKLSKLFNCRTDGCALPRSSHLTAKRADLETLGAAAENLEMEFPGLRNKPTGFAAGRNAATFAAYELAKTTERKSRAIILAIGSSKPSNEH
jgi:hypothetical protein